MRWRFEGVEGAVEGGAGFVFEEDGLGEDVVACAAAVAGGGGLPGCGNGAAGAGAVFAGGLALGFCAGFGGGRVRCFGVRDDFVGHFCSCLTFGFSLQHGKKFPGWGFGDFLLE